MKKLSKDRKLYLIKRSHSIHRKLCREASRKLCIKNNLLLEKKRRSSYDLVGYIRIPAPRELSLLHKDRRKWTLKFLRRLRETLYLQRRNVNIDFSGTGKMISDGTMLFYAEMCRLIDSLSDEVDVTCTEPKNKIVSEVLKQIGFYDLINHTSEVVPSDATVVNWKVAHGFEVKGEEYDSILEQYDGKISESMSTGLYHGLTEAMTNAKHHAYICLRPDGLNMPFSGAYEWWMFSQEMEGRLYVVFCDLGVGIPGSLPSKKPSLWKNIIKLGRARSDGRIIHEAVKDSRSRTSKSYRGKGLKQLLEAVDSVATGKIYMFSNKGCYMNTDGRDKIITYRNSIYGTLISWSLPLESNA